MIGKNNNNRIYERRGYRIMLYVGAMLLSTFSCQQNHTPKPHAYFRIDFPEKEYRLFESACPFSFDYPTYATMVPDVRPSSEPCWFNIQFPEYKGTIYLTYRTIDKNFDEFVEDNFKMIYDKIAQKADAVDPHEYIDSERKVYGTIYDIRGNAASSVQFFVTDSIENFLRGSLYFSVKPNHDSLAPVVSFFREDIVRLMESVKWTNKNQK